MKTILNFALAMFCSVTLMGAPANLFSSETTTKPATETTKTSKANKDTSDKSKETTIKDSSSKNQTVANPDYKILERGRKKLEYQYHLYA